MLVPLIVLDHTYWKLNSFCLIYKWSEIVQINKSCAYSMFMLIRNQSTSPLLNHHVCCGLPELITLTYITLLWSFHGWWSDVQISWNIKSVAWSLVSKFLSELCTVDGSGNNLGMCVVFMPICQTALFVCN